MFSSRTLEEMLPFVCERCGFSFFRNLDEYLKIGIRCPRCRFRIDLSSEEIEEVAAMIEACHQAEDECKRLGDEDDP
jgi:predicted Zn-ribbon and HTH transcriptional regulator